MVVRLPRKPRIIQTSFEMRSSLHSLCQWHYRRLHDASIANRNLFARNVVSSYRPLILVHMVYNHLSRRSNGMGMSW